MLTFLITIRFVFSLLVDQLFTLSLYIHASIRTHAYKLRDVKYENGYYYFAINKVSEQKTKQVSNVFTQIFLTCVKAAMKRSLIASIQAWWRTCTHKKTRSPLCNWLMDSFKSLLPRSQLKIYIFICDSNRFR